MNLALILVLVGYFWTKIRRSNSPFAQLENRSYQDLIRLQVDPSWIMQIADQDVSSYCRKEQAFEVFYLKCLKDAVLKGQSLTSSLEGLSRVLGSVVSVGEQIQDLRDSLQAKIFLQILMALTVRVLIGKFWLQNWQDAVLVIAVCLLLTVIWWIFERFLPRAQIGDFTSFQKWLMLLISAGESQPEACQGIQTMLILERKNGVGRREARLQRVIQDLIERCLDDGRRCKRFADTMVAFELLTAAVILGGLLMIPLLEIF